MPSAAKGLDASRQLDSSKMQLEYLELAGCSLDRYITADKSRPSFLEVMYQYLLIQTLEVCSRYYCKELT